MTYTHAQKLAGLNNMNAYAQRAQLGTLIYGAAGSYPGDYPGMVYYVNNVSGSASNDGLTWDTAFAQIATAVTAVGTFQAAASDVETRCIIYIAGTATAYTGLTALPSYCDLVGVGASIRGNGSGIPRIGSDTAAEDGVLMASTDIRGTNFYNLQFQAGTAKSCFTIRNIYRSEFHNCAFMVNGVAASCTTGFTCAKGSGVIMDNCHWGTSSNVEPTLGLSVTGTHWHHCKVTNCEITGLTAAVSIDATTTSNYGSVFKHNLIGSNYGTCAIGISDASTVGNIIYAGNYINATKSNEIATAATTSVLRFPGNLVANAFAAVSA
jgi:hypothetical protein